MAATVFGRLLLVESISDFESSFLTAIGAVLIQAILRCSIWLRDVRILGYPYAHTNSAEMPNLKLCPFDFFF